MSDPSDQDDPILAGIKNDVTSTLGWYFPPARRRFDRGRSASSTHDPPDPDDPDVTFDFDDFDEDLGGYRQVAAFGDNGVLTATTDDGRVFTIVRWEIVGSHFRSIPSPIGDGTLVQATGNPVHIDGLTIVEASPAGGYTIRRFVDWLPVYAQLGVVFHGRPIGMAQAQLVDFTPAPRQPPPD